MKTVRKNKALALLLIICMIAMWVPQVAMAQTPACTQIQNQATINYTVNGVAQNAALSNTASFYVGVREQVIVVTTDIADQSTNPGLTNTTHFQVTNNGNATLNFVLTPEIEAGGTAGPFGGTDVYNGTGIAVSPAVVQLVNGASATVTVTETAPLTTTNGQVSVVGLLAQSQLVGAGSVNINAKNMTEAGTAIGNSSGVNTTCYNLGATTVAVVSNDVAGPNNSANVGQDSALSAYMVNSPTLNINKISAIYSDPVNATSSPVAIPGATVTYTVTINNSGSAIANAVSISDTVPANLTFLTTYNDGTTTCSGAQGIILENGGAGSFTCCNNTSGNCGATGVTAGYASGTVSVGSPNGLTVNPGQTATIKFQATIN